MDDEGLCKSQDSFINDSCVREKQFQFSAPNVANPRGPVQSFLRILRSSVSPDPQVFKTPSLGPDGKKVKKRRQSSPINGEAVVRSLNEKVLSDTPNFPRHALLVRKTAYMPNDRIRESDIKLSVFKARQVSRIAYY